MISKCMNLENTLNKQDIEHFLQIIDHFNKTSLLNKEHLDNKGVDQSQMMRFLQEKAELLL